MALLLYANQWPISLIYPTLGVLVCPPFPLVLAYLKYERAGNGDNEYDKVLNEFTIKGEEKWSQS